MCTHLVRLGQLEKVQPVGVPLLYDASERLALGLLAGRFRSHPATVEKEKNGIKDV